MANLGALSYTIQLLSLSGLLTSVEGENTSSGAFVIFATTWSLGFGLWLIH